MKPLITSVKNVVWQILYPRIYDECGFELQYGMCILIFFFPVLINYMTDNNYLNTISDLFPWYFFTSNNSCLQIYQDTGKRLLQKSLNLNDNARQSKNPTVTVSEYADKLSVTVVFEIIQWIPKSKGVNQ